jgi:enoyl-CoA hydratase
MSVTASIKSGCIDRKGGTPSPGNCCLKSPMPWMSSPNHAKRIILSGQDKVSAALAIQMELVSEVVPSGEQMNQAMRVARNIAKMDPDPVRQNKKAIQRTYEVQGLEVALAAALDIDHSIVLRGTPDKVRFMDIARADGLKAALA